MTYVLARAAVAYARDRGAEAVEGHSTTTRSGKQVTRGELHVGAHQVFEGAGFVEVGNPAGFTPSAGTSRPPSPSRP
ncbi:hypothetical protein ACRAKJ_16645 [Saccharothrix sp. DSM 118769]